VLDDLPVRVTKRERVNDGAAWACEDALMASTLRSGAVQRVLERLHAKARTEDPIAKDRVAVRERELGRRLSPPERYELYGEASLAITVEVGELYYLLAVAQRTHKIVEFGCSHGISTIYLAAALRDTGGDGWIVTTEILPAKAAATGRNLTEAGLSDLVEVRVGDARDTLTDLADPVDMLVLDGRNDLYITIFDLVSPRLAPEALIAADLGRGDPHLEAYQRHVRHVRAGFHSVTLPVDAGIELTVLVGR
jgi:predicted O-methyltransferase YrrM